MSWLRRFSWLVVRLFWWRVYRDDVQFRAQHPEVSGEWVEAVPELAAWKREQLERERNGSE